MTNPSTHAISLLLLAQGSSYLSFMFNEPSSFWSTEPKSFADGREKMEPPPPRREGKKLSTHLHCSESINSEQARLQRISRNWVWNRSDQEDIVQALLLKELEQDEVLGYVSIRNFCYDYLRAKRRWDRKEEQGARIRPEAQAPHEPNHQDQLITLLITNTRELQLEDYELITGYFYLGQTIGQLAHRYHTSKDAMRNRLQWIVERLQATAYRIGAQ